MKTREVKFRAYQDGGMLTSPISSNYGLHRFFGLLYEDAPIMQFTGILDKNRVEIYEGDLITYTVKKHPYVTGIYEVVWKDSGFMLIDAQRKGDKYGVFTRRFPLDGDVYEVIGNIHETKTQPK